MSSSARSFLEGSKRRLYGGRGAGLSYCETRERVGGVVGWVTSAGDLRRAISCGNEDIINDLMPR
jgi:hypothetical protein